MNKSILVAALIIGGAILLNGHLARKQQNRSFLPSSQTVKARVIESLEYALQTKEGDNVIMGMTREVQEVVVDEVLYSLDEGKIWANFTLRCADGDTITSGVVLQGDEFGVYRGQWEFGHKKAFFEVKEKS